MSESENINFSVSDSENINFSINISDSENNSIDTNNVVKRSVSENRININNFLNNELVNIYMTWYRLYNILLGGRRR